MENKEITTLDRITIEKSKLLEALRENREKHETVYELAVSGYWIAARKNVQEKRTKFENIVEESLASFQKEFSRIKEDFIVAWQKTSGQLEAHDKTIGFNFYNSIRFTNNTNEVNGWHLVYPTNHLEDYDKTIRKVELSCYDKIQLDDKEFDRYVMNNWEWRENFVAANNSYINMITGISLYNTGMYLDTKSLYRNTIMISGLSAY